MNLEEQFHFAQEHTCIHRARKSDLFTFGATRLPYVFVGESVINKGDTILRKGEIVTERPAIMLQDSHQASFDGFGEDYEGRDKEVNLIFGRMFRFPALHFKNANTSLEVLEKEKARVIDENLEELERRSDFRTAVVSGPEESWVMCLLIYAGHMTQRSAHGNIREMMERGQFEPPSF